jgi:hypothetical protein
VSEGNSSFGNPDKVWYLAVVRHSTLKRNLSGISSSGLEVHGLKISRTLCQDSFTPGIVDLVCVRLTPEFKFLANKRARKSLELLSSDIGVQGVFHDQRRKRILRQFEKRF